MANEKQENNILQGLGIGGLITDDIKVGDGDGTDTADDVNKVDATGNPTDDAGSGNPPEGGTGDSGEGDPPSGNEGNEGEGNEGGEEAPITTLDNFGIDAKGNIVDANGNIVVNTGEFETDDEGNITLTDDLREKLGMTSDDDSPMIQTATTSLAEEYGLSFEDATGNPLEFSDDSKGLSALVGNAAQQLSAKALDSFFAENTEMVRYYNHLQAGGTAESYLNGNHFQDFANLTEATTDEDKLQVIKTSFNLVNKMDSEQSDRMLKLIQDGGDIDSYYVTSKESLTNYQTEYEANVAEQQRLNKEAGDKANIQYWKDVQGVVTAGDLGKLKVPKTERDSFFDYLSKPVENGQSQSTIDARNAGLQDQVFIEYLRFKGFDLSSLVKKAAATQRADSLSKRSSKVKLAMSSGRNVVEDVRGNYSNFPTSSEIKHN